MKRIAFLFALFATLSANNPPASTLVQVSRLFRPDLMIEVEATAIIPKR
jgi:2-iminobutanoate/2-iminopropanoate deaminase